MKCHLRHPIAPVRRSISTQNMYKNTLAIWPRTLTSVGLFSDLAVTPYANIKCALAPVSDVRLLEPDDPLTKFRQGQPLWNLPLENPSLALADPTFPGDDQNEPGATQTRNVQEAQQCGVRLAFRQPVPGEAGRDHRLSASYSLLCPSAERRQRGKRFFPSNWWRVPGRFDGRSTRPRGRCYRCFNVFRSCCAFQRRNRFRHRRPQHTFFVGKNATPFAVAGAHGVSGVACAESPGGSPPPACSFARQQGQSVRGAGSEAGYPWRPPPPGRSPARSSASAWRIAHTA